MTINLTLFGSPGIFRENRRVPLNLRKAIALMAYIAVTRKSHARDALAALFWPESDQRSSRAALRRTLYRLQKSIGNGILSVTPETIGLADTTLLRVDAWEFERCQAECLPIGKGRKSVDGACQEKLIRAADLYKGDFMTGFSLRDSPEFDEWQFMESERLNRQFIRLLDRLAAFLQDKQRYDQAIRYARRRLAADTMSEAAHRKLMQLYALTGRRKAALEQYRRCKKILETELGAAPDAETDALFEAIRDARPLSTAPPTPKPPQTRYVRSGRVHIAYQAVGRGQPEIIVVPGFVSHLEHLWREPRLAAFFQEIAAFSRLILFDRRGVGLSDRIGDPPRLEDTVTDMVSVMDAAGARRPILMGFSEGGPACIHLAAAHPERISGIILYGTMSKGSRSDDYPWALREDQFDAWLDSLVASWGGPSGIESFAPSAAGDPAFRKWWAEMLRLGSSPGGVRDVLSALKEIDVRPCLPEIKAPTLILHRKEDLAIRVGGARYMAGRIPGARYAELSGRDHWWWIGDTKPIIELVKEFSDGVCHESDSTAAVSARVGHARFRQG